MAYPFGARPWPTVRELIELFTAMGCELREMPEVVAGPDGAHGIRFLYSPEADDFVSLRGMEDDERIPPSEVENWERRLGIQIPKNPNWRH